MDVENMLKFYFGVDYDDIKNYLNVEIKKIKNYAIEVIRTMYMKAIFKKHQNKLVIVTPLTRHQETNQVISWSVLQTALSVPDAERALAYYEKEGYKEVCCFSTFNEDEFTEPPTLPPNLVAQYFRVAYGLDS